MPSPQRDYNGALVDARRQMGELRAEAVRQLYLEYAAMLIRLEREAAAGIVTAERAEGLRISMQRALSRLSSSLERVVAQATAAAARLAVGGHAAGAEAISAPLTASFLEVPTRAIEQMMRRRGIGLAVTMKTLVRRRVQGLAGDVDALLASVVARGVSAARAAQELATILAREDPVLLDALKSLGPRGGRTARAIQEGIEIGDTTSPPEVTLKKARGLLYDARRITISEINTAYHEADVLASVESRVVDLLRWKTSSRHPRLPSSPDICDVFERADLQGYGPGLLHPARCPSLLHPFCQCYTEKVIRPPSEWEMPKRPAPEHTRAPSRSDVQRVLAGALGPQSRKLTPLFVQRQAEAARRHVRLAHGGAGAS